MNPWQLSQQIKQVLGAVTWPLGSGDVVFGTRGVFVFAGSAPDQDDMPPAFPFAAVTIDTGSSDADEPGLLDQQFSVVVAVEVAGDPLGEHAVIGSSRVDVGRSAGAGVAEVSERARAALRSLTGADGASVVVSMHGAAAPATIGTGRQIAFEQLTVAALCTSDPYFAPPEQMKRSGGILSWVGDQCSARWDFLQYRVGYISGTTPAATPGDVEAIIYTGAAEETSTSIVSGRVYSVFADYSPRTDGSVAASSPSAVGAWVRT